MQRKRAPKPAKTRLKRPEVQTVTASKRFARWWLSIGLAVGLLGAGGAWAYQEITRKPDPVPADDSLIPPPATEPLSSLFPAHTAVYGRLSLNGPASALVRYGLSGFGLGAVFDGIPVSRYILPGINALMGYPLLFDGDGELALENQAALESDETRRLLAEIFAEAEGDAVLGIYATQRGLSPMQTTLAVKVRNPGRAQAKLAELRRSFQDAPLFDGIQLEGDFLVVKADPKAERPKWNTLQRDDAFKRTMAHLPKDRFATLYVNGYELRRLSAAYERYLQGGDELGQELLSFAGGLVADPATQALLGQLEGEEVDKQHLGTAATFRLGILQGHMYSDWTPRDPEALRQASEAVMRASTARALY